MQKNTSLNTNNKHTIEISVQVDSDSLWTHSLKNRNPYFNSITKKSREVNQKYISLNSDIAFPELITRCFSTRTKSENFSKAKTLTKTRTKNKPEKNLAASKKFSLSCLLEKN